MKRTKLSQAKYLKYCEELYKGKPKGWCPFCNMSLQEVVGYYANWSIIDNVAPYDDVEDHLLVVSTMHLTRLNFLSISAWQELQTIIMPSFPTHKLVLNPPKAQSVKHLHFHLIKE